MQTNRPPVSSNGEERHYEKKAYDGWSSIPPVSTKQLSLNLTELTEYKKTMIYDVGNPGPGLEQTQKCGAYFCKHFWDLIS